MWGGCGIVWCVHTRERGGGGWGGCGLRNTISAVNTHLNGEEEGVFIINR